MKINEILVEFAPGGIHQPPVIPRTPGKGPFGDDPRSSMVFTIQKLLAAGKTVFVLLPGARGLAMSTNIGPEYSYLNVKYKRWREPRHLRSHTNMLSAPLTASNDDDLILQQGSGDFTDINGRPYDYMLTARNTFHWEELGS